MGVLDMNEDFVSFSLAKKLTLKGFNAPCIAYYDEGVLRYNTKYPFALTAEELLISHNSEYTWVDAPTISQVLKWLRERDIQVAPWYHRIKKQWSCAVSYNNGEYNTILYNDYTDAAMSGIEYALDNVI